LKSVFPFRKPLLLQLHPSQGTASLSLNSKRELLTAGEELAGKGKAKGGISRSPKKHQGEDVENHWSSSSSQAIAQFPKKWSHHLLSEEDPHSCDDLHCSPGTGPRVSL